MNIESANYLVGLEGCGQYFKMSMRNLGISEEPNPQHDHSPNILQFVYRQCAEQILIAYEGDVRKFAERLLILPDTKFFAHIPQFENRAWVMEFSRQFREFALNLLFRIHRVLGTRTDVDYLLEQIADDYIILYQYMKGPEQ